MSKSAFVWCDDFAYAFKISSRNIFHFPLFLLTNTGNLIFFVCIGYVTAAILDECNKSYFSLVISVGTRDNPPRVTNLQCCCNYFVKKVRHLFVRCEKRMLSAWNAVAISSIFGPKEEHNIVDWIPYLNKDA